MTIPSGLHEWAQARGISAFHPLTWSDADRAAFTAWKLAVFRARWRAAMDNGDVERTRRQQGRDYLIRRIREDLAFALAPPPSATYKGCPCHPHRAWASPRSSDTEPRTPAECVAWLTANFATHLRAQAREPGAA